MQLNNFHLLTFFSILTFYFDLILGSFLNFWGLNGLFLRLGKGSNTVLGYTRVVEQLSFSMFSSILIFDFFLILGSFFSFWGLTGIFLGFGQGLTTELGSTHFLCFFPFWHLILTQFWGHFWLFGALTGYFCGLGRVQTLF